MPRFSVETKFKAIDGVSNVLKKQTREAGKLARAMRSVERAGKQTDKGLKALGRGTMVAAAGAAAAGAGIWKMTEAGRSFDAEMSKVRANMGDKATPKALETLTAKAKELGATTEFTAAQAAAGMNELAKAGFTAEQQMGAIGSVLAGASAGELELADAAGILTSTMAGFGLKSDDAAKNLAEANRIMDVMTVASTNTKSSIGSLGESMKSIAPVAKQFGFSLEDSVQMAAMLQDVGIDASEAGNSVKTMLTQLTATTPKVQKMLDRAGVSFVDSYGNMKPPRELFQQASKLGKSMEGNAAQVKAFTDVVGLRGQKAMLTLGRMFNSAQGEQLSEALKNSEGAAKRIAEVKLDNLNGDITKLDSAWQGLGVAMNDVTKGPLRKFTQDMTSALSDPEGKVGAVMEWWSNWGGVIKEVSFFVLSLATAFGVVAGAIKVATVAAVAFKAAAATNPWTLAIMAVIAAVLLLGRHWEGITSGMILSVRAVIGVVNQMIRGFRKAIGLKAQAEGGVKKRSAADRAAALQSARTDAIPSSSAMMAEIRGEIGVNVTGPGSVTATSATPGLNLVTPRTAGAN